MKRSPEVMLTFNNLYQQFLESLPGTLAQDYIETPHHPIVVAIKATLMSQAELEVRITKLENKQ